ncbi:MAG: type II toxin-antitoxin system VapB family antitoxin [Lapillicoccus sp.]
MRSQLNRRDAMIEAVESDQGVDALCAVVRQFVAEEIPLQTLMEDLDQIRALVSERDEDSVLDVMDFVVGNCGPIARIGPTHGGTLETPFANAGREEASGTYGASVPVIGNMVPMSINIKNPRVHELSRRAAELTGDTQTSVIERALVRFLEELEASNTAESRRARVDRILADVDRRLTDADRRAMTTDALYDDAGLPR